jgi:hypothetical protein
LSRFRGFHLPSLSCSPPFLPPFPPCLPSQSFVLHPPSSFIPSRHLYVFPHRELRASLDFSLSTTHSLMRRTSVSLPTRNVAHDPHEKPARYSTKGAGDSAAGILEKARAAWMTQSQRSRYLKTGGILLFVVFLFYYLSPSGTNVYSGGK